MRMIIEFQIKRKRKECVGKTNQIVEQKNKKRQNKTKEQGRKV